MSFFAKYMDFIGETESPITYHRWAVITAASALLGRKVSIPFGHFTLHPNLYTVLVGAPGARKSSSINLAHKLMKQAGYKKFSADRTTKERFILDLQNSDGNIKAKTLDEIDFSALSSSASRELSIVADELADFLGMGNFDFITMLGVLWDCKASYEHKVKHGASSDVKNPYVTMLGGITPTSFATTFPPEAGGQGFLSRMLLVYSEPSDTKIAWPTPPCAVAQASIANDLKRVAAFKGKVIPTPEAKELLSKIYHTYEGVSDPRFAGYNSRRHIHLLKVSVIIAALDGTLNVDCRHVRNAHTLLYYTEANMPKAIAEFGRNKNAAMASTILLALNRAAIPMPFADLWKLVCNDLPKREELVDILKNLQLTEKIRVVQWLGAQAYMPINPDLAAGWDSSLGNPGFLTKHERGEMV